MPNGLSMGMSMRLGTSIPGDIDASPSLRSAATGRTYGFAGDVFTFIEGTVDGNPSGISITSLSAQPFDVAGATSGAAVAHPFTSAGFTAGAGKAIYTATLSDGSTLEVCVALPFDNTAIVLNHNLTGAFDSGFSDGFA